jgi:hypothetical protein
VVRNSSKRNPRLFVRSDGALVSISYESPELLLRVTQKGFRSAWSAFESTCAAIFPLATQRWIYSCRVCDRPGRRLVSSTFRSEDWGNG